MIRKSLMISAMTLALFHTVPAFAQYDGESNARIKRLETELETLSRAIYKGEAPPPGMMAPQGDATAGAATEVRLQQMEAAIRDLTGKVEEQSYAARQMQERLDRVLSELDRRMVDVEARARNAGAGQMGMAPAQGYQNNQAYPNPGYTDAGDPGVPSWVGGTASMDSGYTDAADLPPQPAMGGPTGLNGAVGGKSVGGNGNLTGGYSNDLSPPMPGNNMGVLNNDPMVAEKQGQGSLPVAGDSPAAHYEQAFALLRDKNYEAAGTAFEDFLKRWPNHELSANAKYWLGESWYVRNNFERAARIFAESYQQAPKGPKGPDNLLKLALSLNGMGKKDEACLTLAQLQKEYGASTSPILARATQEGGRMGCK
jgi:tol-pal system protein YbgF